MPKSMSSTSSSICKFPNQQVIEGLLSFTSNSWWFIATARIVWLHCRRWFIQVSALSTLDGSVLDYHGCNGWRGTRVRFRRGSLRDGYHFQGRQQGRKLTIEQSSSQWRYITMGEENILSQLEWVQSKPLNEEQLEGKSGASSRGNSSSNSVY
jgi:hypothetical protein